MIAASNAEKTDLKNVKKVTSSDTDSSYDDDDDGDVEHGALNYWAIVLSVTKQNSFSFTRRLMLVLCHLPKMVPFHFDV